MPAPTCAVAGCNRGGRNKQSETIMHRFPTKNRALCNTWIACCKQNRPINVFNAAICSHHFSTDAYIRDLQHELLNLPPRKRLTPVAVPTVSMDGDNLVTQCRIDVNRVKKSRKKMKSRESCNDLIVQIDAEEEKPYRDSFVQTSKYDVVMKKMDAAIKLKDRKIIMLKTRVQRLELRLLQMKKLRWKFAMPIKLE